MDGPPHLSGEQHPKAKLSWQQVHDIRSRHAESKAALAREYGVAAETIRQIIAGEIWKEARRNNGQNAEQVPTNGARGDA